MLPLIATPGPMELLIILAVILLLFGAAKLPELARGSGRALRIFKAETKGLVDDDEVDGATQKDRPTDHAPRALGDGSDRKPGNADSSTTADRQRNEPPVS